MKRAAAFFLSYVCLVMAGLSAFFGFFDPLLPPVPPGLARTFNTREMAAILVFGCCFLGALVFGCLACGSPLDG